MKKKYNIKYAFTEEEYKEEVQRLADRLCGTSCHLAADAIIEYLKRPDISKAECLRIKDSIQYNKH